MQSLSRTILLLGLVALVAAGLPGSSALGQGAKKAKGETKDVSFKSYDGVELKGTLYPNPSGKRDAVVLILHDFDAKKGGISRKDWPTLARALQEDGYVVLSFDFRGFGESTSVDEKFWNTRKFPQNGPGYIIRRGAKLPETINAQRDFRAPYYPYLVNDIAAAKAYLDRLNDQKGCNTSSTIVIGAGKGATLGAMWMANECRRKKDKNSGAGVIGLPLLLDAPESKDLACGVWLSISPYIGKNVRSSLKNWLVEATGPPNKIPMGFAYGAKDTMSDTLSNEMYKAIKGSGKVKVRVSRAPIKGTSLAGSKLLESNLSTVTDIKKYLNSVMQDRGTKEQRDREVEKKAFYYDYKVGGRTVRSLNKPVGQDSPSVDLSKFMSTGGF